MNGQTATICNGSLLPFRSCERLVSMLDNAVQLENETIHLWGCLLDGTTSTLNTVQGWLDEEEHRRASRFIRKEDCRQYVLAHGCLRAILSRYIGSHPGTVLFGRQATGKPFLSRRETDEPLTFNMAHSHGRMLVAVAKSQEVGTDLEQVRADIDLLKLAERFYARSENALITALPSESHGSMFFRLWVAKEAVLKGQGLGLRSLNECEIVPADHGRGKAIPVAVGSDLQPGWRIQWLSCGAGWEGAVAFQGDRTVRPMPK